MIAIHLAAPNDANGNPQRCYVLLRDDAAIDGVVAARYEGPRAIQRIVPDIPISRTFSIDAATYKALLGDYEIATATLTQLTDARIRGAEAAKSAAEYVIGQHTTADAARTALQKLQDGDPAVWDELPRHPNLSGEYADDPTPTSIARELVPYFDELEPGIELEVTHELTDAWEEGADDYPFLVEAKLQEFLEGDDATR